MYQHDAFLTDHLAVSAQSWISGFRKAYGLDDSDPPDGMERDQWEFARIFDQLASRIVAASHTLDRSLGDLSDVLDTLRNRGIDLEHNDFFAQSMESHLVPELEDELDRMRRRALTLIRYLVHVRSERARAFLARVGACFLRGMGTETVVMCGAVLDAALQETVMDTDVRAAGIRCGKYVSLGNRIEFMGQERGWSTDTVAIAFRLAHARNNAIHTVPDLERDVEDVMRDLVTCLNELS